MDSLKDQGLELETDQLIRMFSILWAVVKNDGVLLSRKDLLRPEKIGPLADWLVDQFTQIEKNLRDGAEALKKTGLGFRDHFESLNAIIVVLGWRMLAVEWEGLHPLRREALRDEFGKKIEKKIRDHFVRWIAVSQWANLWAGQSNVYLEETVRDLAGDVKKLANLSRMDDVFLLMEERMSGWCSKWQIPAAEAIDRLQVYRRDSVRQYRLPLWIWHRLTAKRADLSGIALRAGRARVSEDVDHVVAAKYWQSHLRESCTSNDEKADAESIPHQLGNCQLLATNFNQSKGDRTLGDFLSEVHEFKSKQITFEEWCEHLKTDPGMINSKGKTGDEIAKLIEDRTNLIKDELVEFLRGTSNVVLA